jgi:hypothetical protein
VGLFVAWEVDGEIPDIDAEPSPSNTKNAWLKRDRRNWSALACGKTI